MSEDNIRQTLQKKKQKKKPKHLKRSCHIWNFFVDSFLLVAHHACVEEAYIRDANAFYGG